MEQGICWVSLVKKFMPTVSSISRERNSKEKASIGRSQNFTSWRLGCFKWKWQKPWRLSKWIRNSDETMTRMIPRGHMSLYMVYKFNETQHCKLEVSRKRDKLSTLGKRLVQWNCFDISPLLSSVKLTYGMLVIPYDFCFDFPKMLIELLDIRDVIWPWDVIWPFKYGIANFMPENLLPIVYFQYHRMLNSQFLKQMVYV